MIFALYLILMMALATTTFFYLSYRMLHSDRIVARPAVLIDKTVQDGEPIIVPSRYFTPDHSSSAETQGDVEVSGEFNDRSDQELTEKKQQ